MALDPSKLADVINEAIAATDGDGNPIPTTPEMLTYANAIITTLKEGVVNNATGTIVGSTTAGSPLSNGAGTNGLITSLIPATWQGIMSAGFPTADPSALSTESVGSTTYIMSSAKINFESGNITGQCTSTAENPGPLVDGAGEEGTIDDLSGSDWAQAVQPPLADSALSEKIYTALVKYLNEEGEALYPTNSVTGTCPSSSGPLSDGTGAGGNLI